MAKEKREAKGDNKLMSLIAYILPLGWSWLSGLLVYFTVGKEDDEVRFHAVQAIILGVVIAVLEIIGVITIIGWLITLPLGLLLWLYGLYVGYKAYQGERMLMPVIGEYAVKYSEK